MSKRILVLGATGMLGAPAARALKEEGHEVRIMARDVEKARQMFGAGYDIVPGDVRDLDSLGAAMDDCYGVHISVGGEIDQLSAENVVALAPEICCVAHITYISGATVKEENGWFPMVRQKLNAEKAIMESGIAYTIFCPTWPYEQLARFAREGKPFLMGKQPLPVHFFASQDLAKMVARSFETKDALNIRFYVYGPEAMTMDEALQRYCRLVYPEAEPVSHMPFWLAGAIATLTGNKDMKFAEELMRYFEKTAEVGDPSEANRVFGAPRTTLEEWVRQQQSAS